VWGQEPCGGWGQVGGPSACVGQVGGGASSSGSPMYVLGIVRLNYGEGR